MWALGGLSLGLRLTAVFICLFPVVSRTSSELGPPLIHAPVHFPQPYSLPLHFYYPAVASMRLPHLTTHQKGQCTISMMRVVSTLSCLDSHSVYPIIKWADMRLVSFFSSNSSWIVDSPWVPILRTCYLEMLPVCYLSYYFEALCKVIVM